MTAKERKLDTRKNIKVVTANSFITACGLEEISLKARKLLYIAIAQCKKADKKFFEYRIKATAFADIMGISPSHVYEEADSITDELMKLFIKADFDNGKGIEKYHVFKNCKYIFGSGDIIFEIDEQMTDAFLDLDVNFTQALLDDFVTMNSSYSMAVWHLIQREMHGKKPGVTEIIQFNLDLEELREVTGTQNKLKQVGQFKERVFDKALREIADNCSVYITYTNIKKGRTVTGFQCTAVSPYHIDEDKISEKTKNKVLKFKLEQKMKTTELTKEEKEEYERVLNMLGE